MPTIGAQLRIWTPFLLLCSFVPLAQPTNETVVTESQAAVPVSPSTTHPKASSPTQPSSTRAPIASYDSTCGARTINYITHTLPQQCPTSSWSAPAVGSESTGVASSTAWAGIPWAREITGDNALAIQQHGSYLPAASATGAAAPDATPDAQADPAGEIEADSALDSAHFLTFEEWKKKKLEDAGQNPDSVLQGRVANSEERAKRRPVNVNALDSLGEEGEIEIDFSGFGGPQGRVGDSASLSASGEPAKANEEGDKVAPADFALSKDAGKTCKERFNYASFDCAATVLKTNPKAKSSSAILVENKDSYMLNECSADNKFLIVELCDDILVDTVVLANYEFFSSMFRHFRVSVSDRYPVKLDRWRTLATFEARNSRDIQPFLITEPQIWARYLRIEFLSHYGNEFYCPVSLLRVHGTTMMEQFRREEEEARGDDDFAEPIEAVEGDPVETAVGVPEKGGVVMSEKEDKDASNDTGSVSDQPVDVDNTTEVDSAKGTDGTVPAAGSHHSNGAEQVSGDAHSGSDTAAVDLKNEPPAVSSTTTIAQTQALSAPSEPSTNTKDDKRAESTSVSSTEPSSSPITKPTTQSNPPGQDTKTPSQPHPNDNSTIPSASPSQKPSANSTSHRGIPSSPHPSPPTPTTQESFFKSIHKRLQSLEQNATLSLQYIEHQSQLLSDALSRAQKAQSHRTTAFLATLNATVMQDLRSYRTLYEQLWQSVIVEIEGMKERQASEVGEVGKRLGVLAEELVWQKRMAVVQSTLLLLCLGLVLFVRSGTLGDAGGAGAPIAQQIGRAGGYYSKFFDSPPRSPEVRPEGLVRRRRTFRNMWRSDTSARLSLSDGGGLTGASDVETEGARSPLLTVEFSPESPEMSRSDLSRSPEPEPSPAQSPDDRSNGNDNEGANDRPDDGSEPESGPPTPESMPDNSDRDRRVEVLATQSGPATPRGSRDTRPSWEEVDRAVDRLRAENGDSSSDEGRKGSGGSSKKEDRKKENMRSPLRRSESYGGEGDC